MGDNHKLAIIIDDELMIRDLLGDIFNSMGYETLLYSNPIDIPCNRCSNPNNCILGNTPPELLITDIEMPGMNGVEFIAKLKQKGCKVKNKAIMSGSWNDDYIANAKKLDCKLINKPFSISKITRWVNSLDQG